jgi:hypothetical protein
VLLALTSEVFKVVAHAGRPEKNPSNKATRNIEKMSLLFGTYFMMDLAKISVITTKTQPDFVSRDAIALFLDFFAEN